MMRGSLSLFQILTELSEKTEKRLMINIQTVKHVYNNNELNEVEFILSK